MAEWTSANSYSERITNLRKGSGEFLDGTGVALSAPLETQSVFDDGVSDELLATMAKTGPSPIGPPTCFPDIQSNELLDTIFPFGVGTLDILAAGSGPGIASTVVVYESFTGRSCSRVFALSAPFKAACESPREM